MLDDVAFATAWVESRDRAHPRGEHALMLELRQKGIDATVIAATLRDRREAATRWEPDHIDDGTDEAPATPDETAARTLLARHDRALARVADPRQRRQKAYALLARNGFSPEIAASLSRAVVETTADDHGPSRGGRPVRSDGSADPQGSADPPT
jgi:regulatory protein